MSRQDIDGRVQGGKTGLAGNFGKASVVGDKVDHFLLHVLAKVLHAIGTLSQGSGEVHVIKDLGSVFIVLEGESPIGGKVIGGDLVWDFDGCRSDRWSGSQDNASSGQGCGGLQEITTVIGSFLKVDIVLLSDWMM